MCSPPWQSALMGAAVPPPLTTNAASGGTSALPQPSAPQGASLALMGMRGPWPCRMMAQGWQAGQSKVQVWDAADRSSRWLEMPWPAEAGTTGSGVGCMAMTGAGRYVVAGVSIGQGASGADQSLGPQDAWLSVWDLQGSSNAPLTSIPLPEGKLATAASISADGCSVTVIVYESSLGAQVWRWEVGSNELSGPVTLPTHTGCGCWGFGCSLSPDGCTAVARDDSLIQVWSLTTGNLAAELSSYPGYVMCASISADGRRIVSSDIECLVKVWDVESNTCLATLEGHTASVPKAALSADGRHVVSASYGGALRVWQLHV